MISEKLRSWYRENKRELPWRNTKDPYLIWISEIMLQQTRVEQGIGYFLRFTERFPDVFALAEASEDEVLKYWEGLGYYSRARNLHETAKRLVGEFNGIFPKNYKDILSLRGVGEYTASAITSFVWNQPYAAVDGNVYRVLSRLFAVETPIDTTKGKKEFTELAAHVLDVKFAGEHNQAMMEFGALHCVPRNPSCQTCVLGDSCLAYAKGAVSSFPQKQGKIKTRSRYFHYFHILVENDTLLSKRPAGDIWQGLYEFPLIETEVPMAFHHLEQTDSFKTLFSGSKGMEIISISPEIRHILSHQVLYATFYRIRLRKISKEMNRYDRIPSENVNDFATPKLLHVYLDKIE